MKEGRLVAPVMARDEGRTKSSHKTKPESSNGKDPRL
jgi:hypothetical protein